ncbi:MAG: lipid-binding SYLF domain-containing protein [Tepidisphaeraceae bacterium]
MKAFIALIVAGFSLALVGGCSTAPKTEQAKQELRTDADQALAHFKSTDAGLEKLLANAVGHAVFPSVGKGGLIAGAAYGHGSVYEKGAFIGYADLRQGSIGAQIGGQEFSQLIVFQTPEALYKFKNNNFTFGADASAVALKSGAAAQTEFKDGVAVFADAKSGLMASAALTGQKFTFLPKDVANADTAGATTKRVDHP